MAQQKKKRIGLWAGILVCFIFLLIILKYNGCIGGSEGIKVTLDTVTNRNIIETVDASGKIYPETEVVIKADVSGEIVALPVEAGDSVLKGQLLMKIDPAIYRTEVTQAEARVNQSHAALLNTKQIAAQAKAQFKQAQSEYQRNKQLYQDKVISISEFDQLKTTYLTKKANYQAAKANIAGSQFALNGANAGLAQARENLQRTVINAPRSGTISQLLVKNGERVVGTQQMDGSQLMSIADLSRMEVRVDVSETDITKVHLGDTGLIQIDAYRNHTFKGIVSKIAVSSVALNNSAGSLTASSSAEQVTNYTVHILILPSSYAQIRHQKNNRKYPFKPGMSASVKIQTRRINNAISVPINAVTTRQPTNYDTTKSTDTQKAAHKIKTVVFTFDSTKKKVTLTPVKTGIQNNEYIQILKGLKKGDKVVVAPYSAVSRTLKNKMTVTPVAKDKLYQSDEKE